MIMAEQVSQKVSKRKRDESDEPEDSDDEQSTGSESEADETTESGPVLSHAQKRRQKKLERKLEKKQAKELRKKNKRTKLSNNDTKSELPKRQNSVWVGNLLFRTTENEIRTFFDGVGEISRVHMPMKTPANPGARAENRGYVCKVFFTLP
jgi:hypothetical protein